MSNVPFHDLIGIEVLEASGGSAWVRAPDTPVLKNHFGTMHGGMLFTLGEVAAAVAITRMLGERLAGPTGRHASSHDQVQKICTRREHGPQPGGNERRSDSCRGR
jgi:hypothetical protein